MTRIENALIRRLPVADRARLLARCEPVQLALSAVLVEAGAQADPVFFPVDAFVSEVLGVPGHPGLEVGMIGREGMVGATRGLGVTVAPFRSVVQGAGSAWRLGGEDLDREMLRSDALRGVVHRYLYGTMVQLGTASACRRFHALGPRLARWLLMSHDRAHADEFRVTHEFLGLMLGVRRVGVTLAAGALQATGAIRYRRGHVTVLDREGLEAQACSCYRADLRAYRAAMRR